MKLNRKGYLTVEVILASVVAVSIALFLMEITIKLVNITDDAYVDTELFTDKALIIKNIKERLEEDIKTKGGITSIICLNTNKKCTITFCNNDTNSIEIVNNEIVYGEYTKKINNSLSNINIYKEESLSSNYILFQITADTKFSKEPFEADIIVYNNKTC